MGTIDTHTALPRWQRWGQTLGFHVPMLAFAMRTALAAFAALALAKAIGLEHPHWAAMSVWASSQPLREHLLSRSAYRFAGSVFGVLYAVALVLLAQDNLWVLALGLALWGAVCAFFGNLQRGYMVYGWMLAGYSAAMVVLLHHGPADAIGALAWDRMGTVVVGVAMALAVSWCLAPRRQPAVLIASSRQALAQVLLAAQQRLRAGDEPAPTDCAPLLSQLAQVEELLELYPEGSRTSRRTAQAMHWQQHCALEVVYHLGQMQPAVAELPGGQPAPLWSTGGDAALHAAQMALADALQPVVQALQAPADACSTLALHAALQQALQAGANAQQVCAQTASASAPLAVLCQLLQQLQRGLYTEAQELRMPAAQALPLAASALGTGADAPALAPQPAPLHRDRVGARQAAWRAGASLLVVGVLWAWTQSSIVGFAMLGLAVMLLVFSAFESPSRTMAFVLRGQLIGAGLALLCQTLVWPWAQSSWQMVAMLLPFALIGGLVFAHKRTAAGALDTNMAMFILLAPAFPDARGLGQHAGYALAVVAGPALAWVIYRLIYPTHAQQRMQVLAQTMLQELPALAQRLLAGRSTVPAPALWQAQMHHRLLRLTRWNDKLCAPQRSLLTGLGLSLRGMHTAMCQLQQWSASTALTTPAQRRTARRARVALQRTQHWGRAGAAHAGTSRKLQLAWQALAQQPALPAALQRQVWQVAQHDIAQLEAARQAWR